MLVSEGLSQAEILQRIEEGHRNGETLGLSRSLGREVGAGSKDEGRSGPVGFVIIEDIESLRGKKDILYGEVVEGHFVEVLRPQRCLAIFGAGHVGQSVARVAAWAGFRVVVYDDREEFLGSVAALDPLIEVVYCEYERVEEVSLKGVSSVVIVTRGHQFDEVCLKKSLSGSFGYIGMIGSRRRVKAVFQRLVKEGYEEEMLEHVKAPIGLQINARSPQEIAIAIVAEIIQTLNR